MRIGAFVANLAVLLLFGIGIPWLKGFDFLDLFLLIPYSILGVFYTSPRAVAIASEAPISLSALGRAALTGWAIGMVILATGLMTINIRIGYELLPPVPVLLCLVVLGLMACLLTAAVAVRAAIAAESESAARSRIRIGFLILICVFLAAPRLMGEELTATVLGWMTPEGMVRVTMVLAPVMAVGTLLLLRVRPARYTG